MTQKILISLVLMLCFGLTFSNQKSETKKRFEKVYIQKQSLFDFEKTVETIKNRLAEKKVTIFSTVDHKKNANGVQLKLRPTTVIIFGNPKVGTLLMQEDQKVSFELPLKISIYEDEKGKVQVVYYDVRLWGKKFNIKNIEILENISKLYDYIVPVENNMNNMKMNDMKKDNMKNMNKK
ncbi:DUF302 domain-containing protein [Leptotrichia sp. OH3620_COT-345]|uniref:DUF302 domain-containing protein n=1 Tax=Leptotrichia sp. OH3620_COT-345 TaxID=2491048 RepID=UPI000F64FBFD|nr:DUF302 domain-containing protein [Leptotrichia sp. OH3620_COT-345]RRD39455.1 DUF302 domain-containing protein [Leptotrichia sp. OH3620_COT-345]